MVDSAQMRKLIVLDDEPMMIRSLTRRMKAEGYRQYEISGFTNQGEALAELAKGNCFAFITDLMMPVVTGDKVVEYIHKMHPEQKCIVITAFAERDKVARIAKAGNTTAVLTKPLVFERLIETLEKLESASPASTSVAN